MHSFSARDYRILSIKNNNIVELVDLLERKVKVGKEIGSESYMKKSLHRFLKTANLSNNFLLDESSIEFCKPENKVFPKKNEILIAKDGGGGGLGEVALYPYCNKDNRDSLSAGIIAIKVKTEKHYYVLGFLKSQHFKDYIDLNTAQGSTIRHSKLIALQYKIPFPTINNNQKPQDVETLVSLIVQNIIDKEQQIKNKNTLIDDLIEEELQTNQQQNSFSYSYPTINEIKEETRLDTGLYEKEFKKMDFLIRNYENGFFKLLSKYEANRGNNLAISIIGESIYSETQKDNFYRLFTNVELSNDRTISNYRWLGNKNKLKLIPPKTIFLSADGTVGRCIYLNDMGYTITNYHPWNINRIRKTESEFEDVFVAMFLGFLYKKNFYEKIKDKANGGGIKLNHLERYIKIPNFPKYKQQEIAKEYYNPLGKNNILTLQNYLEKEKERNKNIGIFQLNMEVFELKERLSDLIHKIITEEKIEIVLDY
ncbi:hypothetical protein HCW_06450 [Helicobacter cetorum MIT 00-7128]|uniref:Type I restriction modification DNA specificity domain-containing protein n=2 Tax=Helicobacter cetorum TaxID=138563 RepID=I0ENN1_HELC0|nr:hypothetical protein HCW_06450 [Helicobacter cetorum MIT 00-7128]